MRHVNSLNQLINRRIIKPALRRSRSGLRRLRLSFLTFVMLGAVGANALQDSPALRAVSPHRSSNNGNGHAPKHQESTSQKPDLEQYEPLIAELGRLANKLQQGVQLPAARTQSKLLPLLPSSTTFYFSLANYGDALYQANQIFHQQLPESPALNELWQNKVGMAGMIVDEAIGKFHEFCQYLGDEIDVSMSMTSRGPSVVVLSEARKPGLKAFINQLVNQYGGPSGAPVRVFTPQQLAIAKAGTSNKKLLMLVRPDYVIVGSDLPTLQAFNTQLNRGGGRFATTPFGQRVVQAYQGGASMVLAADLEPLLALRPHTNAQSEAVFEQSGFADLKYLVVQGKHSSGLVSSYMELSFTGPRKGIASWLAAPGPIAGLDFVSTDAAYAGAVTLKNPVQVFDDIKSLAESNNPMASTSLAQLETELNLNLRQDLLSKLTGQIAFAVDGPLEPIPAWKVIAQISDFQGLQQTIKQLVAMANSKVKEGKAPVLQQETENGLTYYSLKFFNAPKPIDVVYTFVDGYLVVAGSREMVKDAVKIHQSGNSLAKSSQLHSLMPSDRGNQASALIYQNTTIITAAMLKQLSPSLMQVFQTQGGKSRFSVSTAYGDESAIHVVSNSQGFDLTMLVVASAVAIPNIIKARTAASESAAAATVRAVNTAEIMYQTTYNKYAPDLATLGPGQGEICQAESGPSESRACLLDGRLGNSRCTSGRWCTKDAFRYSLSASCRNELCSDYAIVATPVDPSSGGKSFCSTSDGVVRSRPGLLPSPISPSECVAWEPI